MCTHLVGERVGEGLVVCPEEAVINLDGMKASHDEINRLSAGLFELLPPRYEGNVASAVTTALNYIRDLKHRLGEKC